MFPCLVYSVAIRLLFSSFTSFQVGRSVPSFCMTYSIASSHALSQALVTSRNAMYASFLFCRRCLIMSLILSRWSTVAFDFCPKRYLQAIEAVYYDKLASVLWQIYELNVS